MCVSFALNNAASVTVNYDRFFNKFHSCTVDGQSILLSEMDNSDLQIIRKVLVERYDFYEAARKLRDYIDEITKKEQPKVPEDPTLPYKSMLNEVFGISMESMKGRPVASGALVTKVCNDISVLPDSDNWRIDRADTKKEAGEIGMLMEYHCKQDGDDYVYAKILKCDDAWAVHTRKSTMDTMTWHGVHCSDALDALNYIANRYW